jgi:phosphatidate cytidylyltransferase
VSPGKTVSGAIGGLLTSVLVTWLYVKFLLVPTAQLAMTPLGIVGFGLAISAAGQIGDLVESLLKREAGVKDSGGLLPGHGGVLDRLDSLFFVLPVSFLLVHWLLTWAPR